ncbi:MAG: DUF5615 family PIN-like protein [Verrucomicrobia bacterium]|nr:DUF5615 family PIN-like protein [Verrucomicrobiota bacterium]
MKVLLDHCVPRPLRRHLPGHEVATAHSLGWSTLKNGELLAAAEAAQFDVMITSDKNLRYQQNLADRRLAILLLATNFLPRVIALAPQVLATLSVIRAGEWRKIE